MRCTPSRRRVAGGLTFAALVGLASVLACAQVGAQSQELPPQSSARGSEGEVDRWLVTPPHPAMAPRRRHRGGPGWGVGLSIGAAVALVLGLAAWVRFGPEWRAGRRRDARLLSAPAFSFHGAEYTPHAVAGGSVNWRRGGEGARALPEQVSLARVVFSKLRPVLASAAEELIRTHPAWLDTTTAAQLASQMRVDSVIVHSDTREAAVYAKHPKFSGHFAEIVVTRAGHVIDASLIG